LQTNINNEATARANADTAHANLTSPHSATSAATASRLVLRDANGRAQVNDPLDATDIANKGYADGRTYFARDLKPVTDVVIDKTNIFANPPLNIMGPLHHITVDYSAGENYGQPVLPDMSYSYWDVYTSCGFPNRALQIAYEIYEGTTRRIFVRRRHVDNSDYSQWGAWVDIALKGDVDVETTARANADSALQTNITNEATDRAAGDASNVQYINTLINNEVTSRANADSALQSQINTKLSQSYLANGYMVFSNGFKIQWGTVAVLSVGTNIIYPITFSQYAIFFKMPVTQQNTSAGNVSLKDFAQATNLDGVASAGSGLNYNWFAIGV
jgi:hypothetical protein